METGLLLVNENSLERTGHFQHLISEAIGELRSLEPEFSERLSSINANDIGTLLDFTLSRLEHCLKRGQELGLSIQLKDLIKVVLLQSNHELLVSKLTDYYMATFTSGSISLRIHLESLGWDSIQYKVVQNCRDSLISAKVRELAELHTSGFRALQGWIMSDLKQWLLRSTGSSEMVNDPSLGLEILGKFRVSQLFDIILDFPETIEALSDLEACLNSIDMSKFIESTLKEELTRRLVHCSKPTEGILLMYINLTKVMKRLFPTIETLESIADPLKRELRKRGDTFKCIINTIAEDQELYALLDIKQKSVKEKEEFSSDEDEGAASEWQPIPRSASKAIISTLNKRSDIVSMLINIYGSQEQFMQEYRLHLSKKLVNNANFDVSHEIEDLQMLKKRFGESIVHKCEVMIQDVLSSKRINGYIHEDCMKTECALPLENLDCLIVSSYFWPIEEDQGHFHLPPQLSETFEIYADKYSYAKASRKLRFHEQLGTVSLTLEFENGSKTWDGVSPLHAAIISLFDGCEHPLSSLELTEKLGVSLHKLRKEIPFWESRGVITRSKVGDEFYYTAVKRIT